MPRIYNTRQQKLVLSCLKSDYPSHMTAEDILLKLREKDEKIGLTTVYRTLYKLVSRGIVIKFSMPNGTKACYKFADSDCALGEHYHLLCTDCGRMIHLECTHLDNLSQHILSEHLFSIDSFKTVFYGKCYNCALNEDNAK